MFRLYDHLKAEIYTSEINVAINLLSRCSAQRSGFDSRRHIFWEVVGWKEVHSASWVQLRSYLGEEEEVAAPV
jgi:hypothetical protein